MTLWFDCPVCRARNSISGATDWTCNGCKSHIGMNHVPWKETFHRANLKCPKCGMSALEPANSEPEKDIFCLHCHGWYYLKTQKITRKVISKGMAEVDFGKIKV
jgi:hypothetical protein